ncbi:permease [Rossellomorea sp. DA94]|uniref:permease n=1 Tax=Rossellomorea sp. DA94 TaxID=3038653 RepID=UPI00244D6FCB|nr:permease [Rossellomorea sp. DA94]WGG46409.1 permease [Rossellomorea sp. DA94]
MKKLKRYRFFLLLLVGLIILTSVNRSAGWKAAELTGNSMLDMLFLLPPVLVLVGLLDKWVEKETMIRYMGKDSGFYGILFSLLLGTIAAGPLYVAFPMAVLFLKKGASVRYIVFFLGVWSTSKLPVVIYELASFGMKFTMIHIGFGLLFAYFLGVLFEKFYQPGELLEYDGLEEV